MIRPPTAMNSVPIPAMPKRVPRVSTTPKIDCSTTNAPARKKIEPKTVKQPVLVAFSAFCNELPVCAIARFPTPHRSTLGIIALFQKFRAVSADGGVVPILDALSHHMFRTPAINDPALEPIRDKVVAGQTLS